MTETHSDEYTCVFLPTSRDKQISDLVIQYHTECEHYDLTVCTGAMSYDGIMPATYRERQLINDHALMVRNKILDKAAKLGINRDEMLKSIADFRGSLQTRKIP